MAEESFFVKEADYPFELLQPRLLIEGNVISCMLKDLRLFDESKLKRKNFLTHEGRMWFDIISRLRKFNLQTVDVGGIYGYGILTDRLKSFFEEKGGFETLEDVIASTDLSNWDHFLDQMYRELQLCKAYEMGILPIDRKIMIENEMVDALPAFRNLSSTEVFEIFEDFVQQLNVFSNNSSVIDESDIDFDDEWLDALKEGIEIGESFKIAFNDVAGKPIQIFPRLSDNIKGLIPGTSTYIGGYSSVGKSTFWIGIIMSLLAQGHRVLFISNEEDSSRYKLKCLAWIIHNVFKLDFKKSYLSSKHERTEEEIEALKLAKEFWQSNNYNNCFKYQHIGDSDINAVTKIIRDYSSDGYDVVVYDTFKVMISDMKEKRSDLALVRDSRHLDALAKKYNLIMLCSIQLAENAKGKLWLDSSVVSNSKQVKEVLENLFLMRNVYREEMEPTDRKYIKPFKKEFDKEFNVIEKDIELDPTKAYKVLFIDKSRSGPNSDDAGEALLLEFEGDYSTFKEFSWCRPQRGTLG